MSARFAQPTYRENLRDIETSPSAQASELYHVGLREPVRCSTLAGADDVGNWRIHAEFAQQLLAREHPAQLRRIGYRDPQTDKNPAFQTNHTLLPTPIICTPHKIRCQVELLFKWSKRLSVTLHETMLLRQALAALASQLTLFDS